MWPNILGLEYTPRIVSFKAAPIISPSALFHQNKVRFSESVVGDDEECVGGKEEEWVRCVDM